MANAIRILGGRPLSGTISIAGAKNEALPILAASLLCDQPVRLDNIPDSDDIKKFFQLLELLSVDIEYNSHSATLYPTISKHVELPVELTSTMRASILLLAPLLAIHGKAELGLPGGCAIGIRPIDQHIKGLKQLGVEFEIYPEKLIATTTKLKGADITFDVTTVTGTENLIMAAVLAQGKTTLRNVAIEPEIIDLIDFLNEQGAKIILNTDRSISIEGVQRLGADTTHCIIPDRIECGTFLVAGAITLGELTLTSSPVKHLDAVIDHLRKMNVLINSESNTHLHVSAERPLTAHSFSTKPYPYLPTDMQAQLMVLNCIAMGNSTIQETIFENRFLHVESLNKMGASVVLSGNTAHITGNKILHGMKLRATDLRASAGLVLAGLVASGETIIKDIYHLDRGYEKIVDKLKTVGAQIERITV